MAARLAVNLVLSGGGGRGVAQIGALQALAEAGIGVESLVATSVGSLVGLLWQQGIAQEGLTPLESAYTLMERLETFPGLPWTDVNWRFWEGLHKGEAIASWLTEQWGAATLDQVDMPMVITAVDAETGTPLYFCSPPAAAALTLAREEGQMLTKTRLDVAVRASCSVPILLTPAAVSLRQYAWDGALLGDVRADLARVLNPTLPTLVIGFASTETPPPALPSLLAPVDLVTRLLNYPLAQIERESLWSAESAAAPVVVVRLPISTAYFFRFRLNAGDRSRLVAIGHDTMVNALPALIDRTAIPAKHLAL